MELRQQRSAAISNPKSGLGEYARMEMKKQPFAIPTVCKMQNRIDPTPDYQRPPAWSRKQKQLLMDTILRNYDIPKFYWRKVNRTDGVQYEVVDGQQRLRAIWEFEADEYGPKPAGALACSVC